MQSPIIPNSPAPRSKRRSYTKEFKANLVAKCNQGDQSLAQIAMDHQINANLLRKWQRQINQESSPAKLLPVQVSNPEIASETGNGAIEVALGQIIVRFTGTVDPENARTLLNLLR